jgi:hypothetical protein
MFRENGAEDNLATRGCTLRGKRSKIIFCGLARIVLSIVKRICEYMNR